LDLAVLRDLSLIWLLFLTLIMILPFAVLFFYAIKGMIRLRQLCVQYLPIAQGKARLVAVRTEELSHKVASPFIQVHSKTAQANGIVRAIFTRRNKA
jgi:hypothetical protein